MADTAAFPATPSSGGTQALKIVAYTGFAITATAMGYVFLAPAGLLIALAVAWKGFDEIYGTQDSQPLTALSFTGFAGFATIATAMGFVFFPPGGAIMALVAIWRGFTSFSRPSQITEAAPERAARKPSGNAAFDAYREAAISRLEREQADFERFLERLRIAKDKTEFDRFLDAREARTARNAAHDRSGDGAATPKIGGNRRDDIAVDRSVDGPIVMREPAGPTRKSDRTEDIGV